MDLMDAIYTRRSHRGFTPEPVSKETVERLIDAAIQAPSASNTQPWTFAVIQDEALLRELSDGAKTHLLKEFDAGPRAEHYRAMLSNPDFNIFYTAKTLLMIICRTAPPFGYGDCCLAAQNVMLTAHDMGLGTCWIGFAQMYLNQPEVKEKLGIPEDYTLIAPIIVGHPVNATPPAPAKNAPEILFWR